MDFTVACPADEDFWVNPKAAHGLEGDSSLLCGVLFHPALHHLRSRPVRPFLPTLVRGAVTHRPIALNSLALLGPDLQMPAVFA